MDSTKQGPMEGGPNAGPGGSPDGARRDPTQDAMRGVVLAHINLMRARKLCWLALALLVVGMGLSLQIGSLGQAGLGSLAVIAYFVALGFMSVAGNHLGQFGLKYPLVSVIGAFTLGALVMPLAGLIAPVAAFFWLKTEVGKVYRAQAVVNGAVPLGDAIKGKD